MFFEHVRVPITNCLGEEGRGFAYLMSQLPQQRLSIAVGAQAAAQRAFDEAAAFTKECQAFGQPVFQFQNTRFTLADIKTQLQVGWALPTGRSGGTSRAGALTTAETSAAKLWHTDMQGRVTDMALQLHGGAGYMNEYPIARLWRDARVMRILGGINEITKEVLARPIRGRGFVRTGSPDRIRETAADAFLRRWEPGAAKGCLQLPVIPPAQEHGGDRRIDLHPACAEPVEAHASQLTPGPTHPAARPFASTASVSSR